MRSGAAERGKKYPLDAGQAKAIDLPAISKPQKITVEFSSSASEVSVYLIKDFKAGEDPDPLSPKKDQILETKQGKEGSFSVDVPEKTATRVIVRGAKQTTDVTLKVTNKP